LPQGWLFHVALAPDGKTLATTDFWGVTQLWDTGTGKEIHKLAKASLGSCAPTSAFSPDSKTLAVWGLGDTKATLYDVRTGQGIPNPDHRRGHGTRPTSAHLFAHAGRVGHGFLTQWPLVSHA